MSHENRINALQERRSNLKHAIHLERLRPHPNDEIIRQHKIENLQLKDQILKLVVRSANDRF